MIGATRSLSRRYAKHSSKGWKVNEGMAVLAGTVTFAGTAIASSGPSQEDHLPESRQWIMRHKTFGLFSPRYALCETAVKEMEDSSSNHHHSEIDEEEDKFWNTLALYQRWLKDLRKMWKISGPASIKWPNNIPDLEDISALEMDLQMYIKDADRNGGNRQEAQDLEFRIASCYLFRQTTVEQQRKGFNMVKKLAVNGHLDGLCLYGVIWNHGGVAGKEAQPHLAVKYWRQAADAGHLASMYELALALFLGDGTVEDPSKAVDFFIQAAHLGHSGAAFMLADCYLDGVGVARNRSKALEWLMAAAEMGHRQAQRRAEALLAATSGEDGAPELENEEAVRWFGLRPGEGNDNWYREVSLERRFTIGGGSRNPLILFRRKTAVAESRRSEG